MFLSSNIITKLLLKIISLKNLFRDYIKVHYHKTSSKVALHLKLNKDHDGIKQGKFKRE